MLIQKTCQHEEVNFEKTYKQSSLETEPILQLLVAPNKLYSQLCGPNILSYHVLEKWNSQNL